MIARLAKILGLIGRIRSNTFGEGWSTEAFGWSETWRFPLCSVVVYHGWALAESAEGHEP